MRVPTSYKAAFVFFTIVTLLVTAWVLLGDNGQAAVAELFH